MIVNGHSIVYRAFAGWHCVKCRAINEAIDKQSCRNTKKKLVLH